MTFIKKHIMDFVIILTTILMIISMYIFGQLTRDRMFIEQMYVAYAAEISNFDPVLVDILNQQELAEKEEELIEEEIVEEEIEKLPKVYNGISEGDIITNTEFTYYTAAPCCCAAQDDGKYYTKDGTNVYIGMENPYIVACNWLPLGSTVEIEEKIYTVRDTGSAALLKQIGGLDIFVPEGVELCLELGRRKNIPIKIIEINI